MNPWVEPDLDQKKKHIYNIHIDIDIDIDIDVFSYMFHIVSFEGYSMPLQVVLESGDHRHRIDMRNCWGTT